MIQVPADIFEAMHRDVIHKRTRAKWTFNDGHELDVSDRITDVGGVTRSVASNLGGVNVTNIRLSLDNSDKYLSPRAATSTSLLANKSSEDVIGSKVTVEQAVKGPISGWHYIPVFVGSVADRRWTRSTLELVIDDRMGYTFRKPIPEEYELDPQKTHGEEVRNLITGFTQFTSSDIDTTGTFAFAEGVQGDLDWVCFGVIPQLSNLGQSVKAVARSGFGVVYADESGTIKYHTEFPINSGNRTKLQEQFHTVIDETNSWDFSYGVYSPGYATEFIVQYQGMAAPYRPEIETGKELKVGRQTVNLEMPYLLLGRCARQAALVMHKQQSEEADVVSFTNHGIGLTLQLFDRVKVKDPANGVEGTFRVMGKSWSENFVNTVAIRENHYEDYLGNVFAEFDTTVQTSTTEYYW